MELHSAGYYYTFALEIGQASYMLDVLNRKKLACNFSHFYMLNKENVGFKNYQ